MKKFALALLLLFSANILLGNEYFDTLQKAETYLAENYNPDSLVYQALKSDLLKIISSDRSREQKIAEIKKICPQAFLHEKYLAKAKAGDAEAQFWLGSC